MNDSTSIHAPDHDAAQPGRQAKEKILACVSPSPLSERLVYTASRLAQELNAEWHAVYIESPAHSQLSPEQRHQLMRNLQLAEALGAKLFSLKGKSVVETLAKYARTQGITKLVAGRPLETRRIHLLKPSIADQLVSKTGDLDLYLVSNKDERLQPSKKSRKITLGPWSAYLQSIALVLIASGISALINPFLSSTNLVMVYLLAVVIAAIYLGRGPAILASILGAVVFDFFFVPILYTLTPEDTEYLVTFGGLLIVSLVISQLTAKARKQAETAQQREAETAALYGLSRDLAISDGLEPITQVIVTNISHLLKCPTAVFIPQSDQGMQLKLITRSPDYQPVDEDPILAARAFERQRKIDSRTSSGWPETQYLLMQTPRKPVGVLGVRLAAADGHLDPKQFWLLKALIDQAALAIERAQLAEEARQMQLLQVTEKLQTALLNSISHDLRTPLVSVTGSLSTLLVDEGRLNEDARRSLIETAYDEADRLNSFVGNILQMTRIQAGAMHVLPKPCDVQDLIGSALERVQRQISDRSVEVDIAADLPLIPVDFVLIVQVLVNLLENAAKYSPAGSPIEISVRPVEDNLEFRVLDRGFGVSPQELPQVFRKFYQATRTDGAGGTDTASGTGLGLSICKGIVEAHGGRILAELRQGGGMVFTFTLPTRHSEKTRSQIE